MKSIKRQNQTISVQVGYSRPNSPSYPAIIVLLIFSEIHFPVSKSYAIVIHAEIHQISNINPSMKEDRPMCSSGDSRFCGRSSCKSHSSITSCMLYRC
jgi:hypothetical protein